MAVLRARDLGGDKNAYILYRVLRSKLPGQIHPAISVHVHLSLHGDIALKGTKIHP